MITKKEILSIAKESLDHFNLKAEIKFLSYQDFIRFAKKSPIILRALKEGNAFDELNIPALVYHEKKDHIYLSEEVLKKLIDEEPITIQRRFIKSVLYHEIFHILYKKNRVNLNFDAALNQEDLIDSRFRKEYPALEAIGRRISKRYLNF
ncbi:hypothetical protein HYV88_03775 [Candidatus Woesearchaeota archaeon]|nr:hypothetical protein [Candidatus Woesearchaeota archaeon]